MMRSLIFIFSLFIVILNIGAQCPSSVPIQVDSVDTKESRCQATGEALIIVSGGVAPYTYSIISGPVSPPVQSTSLFKSLSAGAYIVEVSDQCNTKITKNFNINGFYEIPIITSSLVLPSCLESNGSISVLVTNGSARSPFKYSLVEPSPKIVGPQDTNVFTNLSAGTYVYRVTDSCGNFQTRTVTMQNGVVDTIVVRMENIRYITCDSFAVAYRLNVLQPDVPYEVTFANPKETVKRIVRPTSKVFLDTFYFAFKHLAGNRDPYNINVKDRCGKNITAGSFMQVLDLEVSAFERDDCSGQYTYFFDYRRENSQYRCDSTKYTLISPSGDVLNTQNSSEFSGYAAGRGYKIIREDCCRKDTLVFDWFEQPPLKIINTQLSRRNSCKEGTTNIGIMTNNTFVGDLIIISGPPNVRFADGRLHEYFYPDTIKNISFGNTYALINYFTAGTYKIQVMDNCGSKDSLDIIIRESDLRHTTFDGYYVRGCENANKIFMKSSTNFQGGALSVTEIPGYNKSIGTNTSIDSLVNVRSGTYNLRYHYQNAFIVNGYLKNMSALSCDVIQKQLKIPEYVQPAFNSPVVTVCGNSSNVTLMPDSTKGVAPYLYRITSIPTATPLQESNVFPNLAKGTYTFLMSDACGNSYSQSTSIDTLTFPALNATAETCVGDRVTLSAELYPFYNYKWERPNGTESSGHILRIDSLTPLDTGFYKITITPNLFGCTLGKTQLIKVNICEVLPLEFITIQAITISVGVRIDWMMSSLSKGKYFIVERSKDGKMFDPIRETQWAPSNHYSEIDLDPLEGKGYYRIKKVLADGSFLYSNIVHATGEGKNEVMVSPNPASTTLNVNWSNLSNGNTYLTILDLNGRVLFEHNVIDQTYISIPVDTLAKGLYVLKLYQEGQIFLEKFVKD